MKDNNKIRLVYMDPKELAENPSNWRRHPESQLSAITDVINEVGWAGACLFNEATGLLIDGHARRKVAIEQGAKSIPVLVGKWTVDQEKKILATLDPIASMAESDAASLDSLLREVQTGSETLGNLLTKLAEDAGVIPSDNIHTGHTDPDEVPEPPTDPITKPGDLWLLGRHRLLCGDSTSVEDVKRLMAGKKAACVFTDPPYGVAIADKNAMLNTFQPSGRCLTSIKNDNLSAADLKTKLLPAFTNLSKLIMADDCTVFCCAPQNGDLGMMMMMMMMESGLKVRHVLIWKKNSPTFSMGRLDYDYQHEPILLTWGKKHKRPMKGDHRTSVWEVDKPRSSPDHPTMKPVELYVNAYQNNSDPGDNVADIYSGSGTAFVAAEQINRTCYGMEISPQYCDVIVKRWEDFTGQKATLKT